MQELFEDLARHRADRKENGAKTEVYDHNTKEFKEIQWKDISVGDILKVSDQKPFPADLILLSSSEPEGIFLGYISIYRFSRIGVNRAHVGNLKPWVLL